MFDSREIAERALRRAKIIKKERASGKRKIYAIAAVAACLALVVGLSFAIPTLIMDTVDYGEMVAHGAMLFGEAAIGGYVLIGIIGFALGAAVTLFCVKVLKNTQSGEQDDHND